MSKPRRPRNRQPQLPDAIKRLLDGLPIDDTPANRLALTQGIWFRAFDLSEADRMRALEVLRELRRPEREAAYEAEIAMHKQGVPRSFVP